MALVRKTQGRDQEDEREGGGGEQEEEIGEEEFLLAQVNVANLLLLPLLLLSQEMRESLSDQLEGLLVDHKVETSQANEKPDLQSFACPPQPSLTRRGVEGEEEEIAVVEEGDEAGDCSQAADFQNGRGGQARPFRYGNRLQVSGQGEEEGKELVNLNERSGGVGEEVQEEEEVREGENEQKGGSEKIAEFLLEEQFEEKIAEEERREEEVE